MRVALVIACWLAAASLSSAQTIISFDFTGSNPGQTNPWNTGTIIASGLSQMVVSGASGPGWTRASGLSGENAANRFNTSGWTVTTNLATLIANNDFMGFGISVDPGYVMNLNGATVGILLQRNGQGPDQYVLMSNLPGYGLNPTDLVMYSDVISGGNSANVTFNLPNTGLDGLTGSYEFRIIGLNAGSLGGTLSQGIQNDDTPGFRIFNGTVSVVPEPVTVTLVGLGTLAGVATWRYRRRAQFLAEAESALELDRED